MKIQDLAGAHICILGFGREGRAMLHALERYAPTAKITLADEHPEAFTLQDSTFENRYSLQTGSSWLSNLDRFDLLIKSPGIPPQALRTPHDTLCTSPTQIFLDSVAGSGATVIGVTGSKGKSTTASLIAHILNAAGRDVHLIGNIGEPAIAHLQDAKLNTFFVQEMSSYQLMDCTTSPSIAVITSFFPEHLDYHGSLEAYRDAKANICRFQREEDLVFFPERSPEAARIAAEGRGRKIPYAGTDCPFAIGDTHLIGSHNLSNIAAALAVADALGIKNSVAVDAAKQFRGLPHRLMSLGIHHGWEWVDDAISTTPDSTIAALDALGDRVQALFLGGQDRGLDFTRLAERIRASSIAHILLFPGSGLRMKEALLAAGVTAEIRNVQTMEEAVESIISLHRALPATHPSPIALLSPASPSYGQFKNFEEKGDAFKAAIHRPPAPSRDE